ncbi:acetate--CoA ligase family protein [Pseudonocardia kunmingensis]|uniref:acetate--CoA ligase family protein n=1 Tax=Pseudonocardia kunmingensis TaxID=630975 RepID=UPI00248286AF|nr:acetate--CoA ligase family protein [Pseudonocardia kunmingensis]
MPTSRGRSRRFRRGHRATGEGLAVGGGRAGAGRGGRAERSGGSRGRERLGCPVVVKIVSSELPHKSDVGGVAVDVGSGAAAEDAWRQVTEHVALKAPHAATGGVLVERMVPADGVEMIVGVHRDPVFGHLLTVGAGGVLVELLDDVQRRLLPVGRPQAEEMVAALRCHALLTGARGRPACDVDGFVDPARRGLRPRRRARPPDRGDRPQPGAGAACGR